MRKIAFTLFALGMLAYGSAPTRAYAFEGAAIGHAGRTLTAAEPAACREKRWGWHGWGWYPCKVPVNTCEKCKWRWGYKYCWKIC